MANNEHTTTVTVTAGKLSLDVIVDGATPHLAEPHKIIQEITGYNASAGVLWLRYQRPEMSEPKSGSLELDSASAKLLRETNDEMSRQRYKAAHGWRSEYDRLCAESERAQEANYHDPARIIKARKAVEDYLAANPEVAGRLRAEAKPRERDWAYSQDAVDRALRGED